jgi:hypothetical protein
MHGKRTLNKILTDKARKPNRSSYTTNNSVIMIGNWRLTEDADGNLVATNLQTGTSTVVGFK